MNHCVGDEVSLESTIGRYSPLRMLIVALPTDGLAEVVWFDMNNNLCRERFPRMMLHNYRIEEEERERVRNCF